MEDHEKLEKLTKIRKRREDRALKYNTQMQKELFEYEQKLEAHKQKIQKFLEERSIQLQKMQNQMQTEAVSGLMIEKYLMLKEETQQETKKLYDDLEVMTQGYYPLLDKVNDSYKEWDKINQARTKLEKVATDKKEEYFVDVAHQEEMSRYVDFIGKRNPSYD